MDKSLLKAKNTMEEGGYSLVIVRDEKVLFVSYKGGVLGLMDALSRRIDLLGSFASDKVVGKAASLLMLYGGIKGVYTPIISTKALEFLKERGIYVMADNTVPFIGHDKGVMCQMEKLCWNIENPIEGYEIIKINTRRAP